MSVLRVNETGKLTGDTQDTLAGQAKAWCNFDGTGTPAFNGSFNYSSIVDEGVGDDTLNFTNPMADNTYAAPMSATAITGSLRVSCMAPNQLAGSILAGSIRIFILDVAVTSRNDTNNGSINILGELA